MSLKRQESTNSALKERIEKFEDEKNSEERIKQNEFSRRRELKKKRRQALLEDRRLVYFKYAYVASSVLSIAGIIMTFACTVKSLGEYSVFWTYRNTFIIAGPLCLALGFLSCMVTSTLVYRRKDVVMEEKGFNRQSSMKSNLSSRSNLSRCNSKNVSVASNLGEINVTSPARQNWRKLRTKRFRNLSSGDSETESFLESSQSSNGSVTPLASCVYTGKRSPIRMFLSPMVEVSSQDDIQSLEEKMMNNSQESVKLSLKDLIRKLPESAKVESYKIKNKDNKMDTVKVRRSKWKMSKAKHVCSSSEFLDQDNITGIRIDVKDVDDVPHNQLNEINNEDVSALKPLHINHKENSSLECFDFEKCCANSVLNIDSLILESQERNLSNKLVHAGTESKTNNYSNKVIPGGIHSCLHNTCTGQDINTRNTVQNSDSNIKVQVHRQTTPDIDASFEIHVVNDNQINDHNDQYVQGHVVHHSNVCQLGKVVCDECQTCPRQHFCEVDNFIYCEVDPNRKNMTDGNDNLSQERNQNSIYHNTYETYS